MKKEKIACYIRVSTRNQLKGLSIEEQISSAKIFASKNNLDPILFIEKGKSAFSETLSNRPEMKELLKMVEDGQVKKVYAVYEDRISRRYLTKNHIKAVLKVNNCLLYTKNGKIDFSNVEDEFRSDILTLLDERESKTTSKRIKHVLEHAVREGKVGTGSSIPYGYTTGKEKLLIIDTETAPFVEKIFKWCNEGMSTTAIAKKLNSLPIASPRGKKWTDGTVYGILTNETYTGRRKWNDKYFDCFPIISQDEFNRAAYSLSTRTPGNKTKKKYSFLLNDLLICNKCKSSYRGRLNINDGTNAYKCTSPRKHQNCNSRAINRKTLEDHLNNLINRDFKGQNLLSLAILNEKSRLTSHTMEDVAKLQEQLDTFLKTEEGLRHMLTANTLSFEKFQQLYTDNDRKIANITRKLEITKEHFEVKPEEIEDYFKMTTSNKRKLLKNIFDRIEIYWNEEAKFHEITFFIKNRQRFAFFIIGNDLSKVLRKTESIRYYAIDHTLSIADINDVNVNHPMATRAFEHYTASVLHKINGMCKTIGNQPNLDRPSHQWD